VIITEFIKIVDTKQKAILKNCWVNKKATHVLDS